MVPLYLMKKKHLDQLWRSSPGRHRKIVARTVDWFTVAIETFRVNRALLFIACPDTQSLGVQRLLL